MNKAFNKYIIDWNKFPEYDIIYCDPPWEQRMVNYFETIMFKNGQENGNCYFILVFNSENYSPEGTNHGFKIIDSICENLKFQTVFDPFAGVGKTAKRFIYNGKTYIGSEINTDRFNKLKKIIWQEPQ